MRNGSGISFCKKARLLMAFAIILFAQSSVAQISCQRALLHLGGNDVFRVAKSKDQFGSRLYPEGVDPVKNPDSHIMFGFESEYTLRESETLLQYYGPRESAMAKAQWAAMGFSEKTLWIQLELKRRHRGSKEPLLFIHKLQEGLEFLPSELVIDDTLNLEIVLSPMNTLQEFVDRATKVESLFGKGSMQSMISAEKDRFFPRGRLPQDSAEENMGFFNFVHDLDVLDRMAQGSAKYHQNPSKEVLRTFAHPYLGPMTKARHDMMSSYMSQNSIGSGTESYMLQQVSWQFQSFKYIGSTAYRPDIGGSNRFAVETRDAHKDLGLLIQRTIRNAYYLEQPRSQFRIFSELKPFDSKLDYMRLPHPVQAMLEQLFPIKVDSDLANYEPVVLASSTFRNFAYPLREWSAHLKLIARKDLAEEVARAQENYQQRLQGTARSLKSGEITSEVARAQVQGAAADFAVESQLWEALDSWHGRNVSHDQSWNKYWNKELDGKLRQTNSFTAEDWKGSLESRAQQFINKWPGRAKWIEDVIIELKDAKSNTHWSKKRRLLVIANEGLTYDQREAMQLDYQRMLARGSISFPIGNQAGHLYTRFGHRMYDSGPDRNRGNASWTVTGLGIVNEREARPFYSEKLEPVIRLSPEEEINARIYIENTLREYDKTVGRFAYDGSQETYGKLDNNLCRAGTGHSCTSWISTAPIGVSNQSLMRIVGASPGYVVGTNPGWWNGYIATTSSVETVPFLIYWSYKGSLAEIDQLVKPNQALKWNFDPH